MAKIYEALMCAVELREKRADPPVAVEQTSHKMLFNMEEEIMTLAECIESLLPQTSRKIIQFIGARECKATSTIAREFAEFSAARIGLSVLLMCPNRLRPRLDSFFTHQPDSSWFKALRDPKDIDRILYKVNDTKLFVAPPLDFSGYAREADDSLSIQSFLELLKERFDLTVIESSPTSKSSHDLSILSDADSVLVVFESEQAEGTVDRAQDVGLASVLDLIGQGTLLPQRVVRCMDISVLVLTPVEKMSVRRGRAIALHPPSRAYSR